MIRDQRDTELELRIGHPFRAKREEQDQRRPDSVELLLNRQRPEVLEGRWRKLGSQVVGAGADEAEVAGEERRPARVLGDPVGPARAEVSIRGDHGRDQDERAGRQQSSGAASVEVQERDRPGLLDLADQQTGDQEAREDEEDIHADVAARRTDTSGVVEQHEQTATARRPSISGRNARSTS